MVVALGTTILNRLSQPEVPLLLSVVPQLRQPIYHHLLELPVQLVQVVTLILRQVTDQPLVFPHLLDQLQDPRDPVQVPHHRDLE